MKKVRPSIRETSDGEHVLDIKQAYKDFAHALNICRPIGRKISYKRLTKMQKRQAVLNVVLEQARRMHDDNSPAH